MAGGDGRGRLHRWRTTEGRADRVVGQNSFVLMSFSTHASAIFSQLEGAVADAAPLSADAAALLRAQLQRGEADEVGEELPEFGAVCAALQLCTDHCVPPPPGAARLPPRIVAGVASECERSMWRAWYESGVHEVLTRQLVDALAERVLFLLRKATPGDDSKVPGAAAAATAATAAAAAAAATAAALPVVLECGAGNGVLARHLAARLRGAARVVAVDDFSSRIGTLAPVEQLDCAAALRKYAPDVVLASWMPAGVDWTEAVRACASVRGYVLLGEADSSTCGDLWATWGVLPPVGCARCEFEGCGRCDTGLDEDSVAPYKEDGFARASLESVAHFQICRFDSAAARGFSSAVVFTRQRLEKTHK